MAVTKCDSYFVVKCESATSIDKVLQTSHDRCGFEIIWMVVLNVEGVESEGGMREGRG